MPQTGKNYEVAFKEQASGLGSPEASGAGGTGLRTNPSPGMGLNVTAIPNNEVRRDGMKSRSRLGSYDAQAVYELNLRVGEADALWEALNRGTWVASSTLTEATGSLGAITIASNVVTATAGSWITQGIRVGMVVKLTGTGETANNDVWVRVVAVTASALTVASNPGLTDASEATWTLTIAKHLLNGTTERYFTLEERLGDVDRAQKGEDMKVASARVQVGANGIATVTFTLRGTDVVVLGTGETPHFTSPTYSTSIGLVLLDGYARVNGADVLDLTSLDFTLNADAETVAVTGQRKSPDVFMGNIGVDGSVSGIVNDLSEFTALKNETNIELFLIFAENEADPADFISFYFGNTIYTGHSKPLGQDGPLIETLPFNGGVDERGSQYASTVVLISTSAA